MMEASGGGPWLAAMWAETSIHNPGLSRRRKSPCPRFPAVATSPRAARLRMTRSGRSRPPRRRRDRWPRAASLPASQAAGRSGGVALPFYPGRGCILDRRLNPLQAHVEEYGGAVTFQGSGRHHRTGLGEPPGIRESRGGIRRGAVRSVLPPIWGARWPGSIPRTACGWRGTGPHGVSTLLPPGSGP
jgi:hypothetical protein